MVKEERGESSHERSASYIYSYCQIAHREAEVEKVVLQARKRSDRRVRAISGRCGAENELEEALLELTVRKLIRSPHSVKFWRMHNQQNMVAVEAVHQGSQTKRLAMCVHVQRSRYYLDICLIYKPIFYWSNPALASVHSYATLPR